MKKIKLGVLGYGNIGTLHVNNVIDGKCAEVEISAICDLNDEKLEQAKEKAPNAKLFKDAKEMIESGVIDSLLVAVPHYDHPKYAIMALEKGLNVLIEKPAGVDTKQVKEMIEIAEKSGGVFGIMMNQRTNCIYRKMREIVKSGKLGQIKRTSLIITDWYRPQCYYDSGDWRATWSGEGGGVLLNQCPHNLDLWQWICGMPVTVDSKMRFGRLHDVEIEDEVTTYVEYANGATGTFITTTGEAPGANRFEVVCDGGTLVCEGNKLILKKLEMRESEFTKTNKVSFAAPKCTVSTVETDGLNLQHRGIRDAFAAAILRDEPLIADGREGINGLMLSNAMHLSAWTGKTVELPFDEQLFKDLLMEHVKTSRRKVSTGAATEVADLSDTYGSKASK